MSINVYYSIMSIYGWYHWTRKKNNQTVFPIAKISENEKKWAIIIFIVTSIGVILIYQFFDKFTQWSSYVDTLTTGLFFVGMWLLSKRKIENWLFFLIGNILAIPLFVIKGFALTGFLYLFLSVVALLGYQSWKKQLPKQNPMF